MFKKSLSITGIVLAAALAMGTAASAATVTFTQNYGTDFGAAGTATAGGGARVIYGTDNVLLTDSNSSPFIPFYQEFSLASITNTIESISLSLTYANAGNGRTGFFPEFFGEIWSVYAATQLTPGGNLDTGAGTRAELGVITGTNTVTYDLTGAVLSAALVAGKFGFWFGEGSVGSDQFTLSNASVAVSAVPLPAAGLLLLGALGGLSMVRRRKTSGTAVAA